MRLGQLDQRCGESGGPDGQEIVVYRKGGLRSDEGYRKLKRAGYDQVRCLDGGITCWCGAKEE